MMAEYDFKEGKKRILEIFDRPEENMIREKVPVDKDFTFDNGYYCWVTGIFVDIRNSTKLFSGYSAKKATASKIIRSFTSEIIEILNTGDKMREIGIRGDCVYGIFTTPSKEDIFDVFQKAMYINAFIDVLNGVLRQKNLSPISVGIGVASAQDLVLKAGREGSGINSKVWIGEAVTKASNLSSVGSKGNLAAYSIVISESCHHNIKDVFEKTYGKNNLSHFNKTNIDGSVAYCCNLKVDDRKN